MGEIIALRQKLTPEIEASLMQRAADLKQVRDEAWFELVQIYQLLGKKLNDGSL